LLSGTHDRLDGVQSSRGFVVRDGLVWMGWIFDLVSAST
jgi:hypothetical protein